MTKAAVGEASVSLYSDPPPVLQPDTQTGVGQARRPGSPLASAQTLSNGTFILHAPGPGSYWVNIHPGGGGDYEIYDEPITLTARGPALQLMLKPRPMLRLKLQAPGGGPVTGPVQAWEWLLWGDHHAAIRQVTRTVSADGMIEFPPPADVPIKDIKKALVEIRAASGGCGQIRLENWPDGVQPVTLDRGFVLSGTLLDAAGKPLPDAKVSIYRSLGETGLPTPGAIEAKTSATGQFEASALLHGGYFVRAEVPAPGRAVHQTVSLVADRVEVQLKAEAKPGPPSFWDQILPAMEQFPVPYAAVAIVVDPVAAHNLLAVTGRFMNGVTHEPLGGIIVILGKAGRGEMADVATTHPDGVFTLRAAEAGTYNLNAQAEKFGYFNQNVELPVVSQARLELTLSPAPTVRVKLLAANGKPIPPGPVDLSALAGAENGTRGTAHGTVQIGADGTGDLEFPNGTSSLGGDANRLLVTAISTTAGVGQIRLDHWKGGPVTINMQPGWKLSGQVLDSAGHPVPGAAVELSQWLRGDTSFRGNLNSVGDTHADSKGRYEIKVLPDTTCFVQWTPPGETAHAAVVTFSRPQTTAILTPLHLLGTADAAVRSPWMLDQVMEPLLPPVGTDLLPAGEPAVIRGRVTGHPGEGPLADALVLLYAMEDTAPVAMAQSAANGSFRIDAPGAGTYRLAVGWKGYLAEQVPVDVPAAGLTDLALNAPADPALRLSLLDAAGKPTVSGKAQLWLEGNSGTERLTGASLTEQVTAPAPATFQPAYSGPLLSITDLQLWVRVEGAGVAHLILDHWPAASVPVRLHPGVSLEGQVADSSGRPLNRITVTATRVRPDTYQFTDEEKVEAVTDAAGHFSFHNLFPALYRVDAGTAQPNGGQPQQVGSNPHSRTVLLPQAGSLKLVLAGG